MPNVMAALPNVGGALCSTPQTLADAHYSSAVQWRYQDANLVEICWGAPNAPTDLSRWWAEVHHCDGMWGRHCCLTIFFRLSICALVAKI